MKNERKSETNEIHYEHQNRSKLNDSSYIIQSNR
jgi:hypothetical protein